jgi:hypothetical protein
MILLRRIVIGSTRLAYSYRMQGGGSESSEISEAPPAVSCENCTRAQPPR